MKKILIVGLGVVGRALFEIAKERNVFEVYGYDIDPSKTVHSLDEVPRDIDYIHIAIPYESREKFIRSVVEIASRFSYRIIFIHSTVEPGTSTRIHEVVKQCVAYTPVRGVHRRMKEHLLFWTKWVACIPPECLAEAVEHLQEFGFKVRPCSADPSSLELAKLWETVYRAVLIASWHEIHRISKILNCDIEVVAEFVAEVHRVLRDRPVMYPDVIGGTCLIPNTKILLNVYESPLLRFVLESNEKRRNEVLDPGVRHDIEKLRNMYFELVPKDYF